MKLVKTTAVLLLLVQTFHLASLQEPTDSTDSPGRPIDQSWWRGRPNELPKDADGDQANDADYSGIASGSMATNSEEEGNIGGETNETESDVATASPHAFHNGTKKKHKHHKHTDSSTITDANATNHSVDAKEANSKATSQNSTGSPDVPPTTVENSMTELANDTGSANVTSAPNPEAPDDNETTTNSSTGDFPPKTSDQNSTVASNATGNGTTNANPEDTTTKSPSVPEDTTTKSPSVPEDTTTKNPNVPEDTTTKNSNVPEDTTTKNSNIPEDTTSAANPNTPEDATSAAPVPPEKSNNTDKSGGGSGSSLERGVASDPNKSTRQGAWGAVLGIGVAVAVVGLVAYVILKRRRQKAFSHRKLVEDFPTDPVHRLDNNEPLDLNFGGSAYYNPGLQGDNIQMSNIPGRP